MAEGILRTRGNGRIEVFSAGTAPSEVHPLAIRALQAQIIDISQHRSKHLQEFLGQDFDYIITVCDRAREVCPIFPGDPVQIHWSFPDPVEVEGTENERLAAFREIALQLNTRIGYLLMVLERSLIGKQD
jgi:protein-tyrosine-phosphatase